MQDTIWHQQLLALHVQQYQHSANFVTALHFVCNAVAGII
jgi:hypothetical protein